MFVPKIIKFDLKGFKFLKNFIFFLNNWEINILKAIKLQKKSGLSV